MLAQLMVNRARSVDSLHSSHSNSPLVNGCDNSEAGSQDQAQARWEAYLQSRVRASRNIQRRSRPSSMITTGTSTSATEFGPVPARKGQSTMCLNFDESHAMQKSHSVDSVPVEKETVVHVPRPLEILPSHPVHPAQVAHPAGAAQSGPDGSKGR